MTECPDRDDEAMDDHYAKHVDAMTREGLHSKAAIAGELAWRDLQIERLQAKHDAVMVNSNEMREFIRIQSLEHELDCRSITQVGRQCNCDQPKAAELFSQTEQHSLFEFRDKTIDDAVNWLTKNYPALARPACRLINDYKSELHSQTGES